MVKSTRLTAASLAIAALTLGACKGDSAKQDSLKQDSALAANLAMASADSAAKVKLADTATSSTSKAPRSSGSKRTNRPSNPPASTPKTTPVTPAPAPKPAGPTSGSIASGTTIALASTGSICTNTTKVGDDVTAVTTESVSGTNGVSIPAGATVSLTATTLKRSENAKDNVVMEFRVNSVSFNGHSYPLNASVQSADVRKVRDEPKSKDVQKVAAGAVVGAIAGKLIGKSTKGAVIGGAAGAAAGAGVAAATANYQGCIDQGKRITVKLDGELTLPIG